MSAAVILTMIVSWLPAVEGLRAGPPASPNAPTVRDAAASADPNAHLDYAPGQAPRFWSVATADTIMARWPDYSRAYHASWTYVHGYALRGFEMLYRATGDKRYLDYIQRYVDRHVDENGSFRVVADGRGRERETRFDNQDNMMPGNTLVMLYERTQDERYKRAATTIRRALDDYPRNSNGGLWHARSMNGQWWIDGIFMSQMFLTRYGRSIGDTAYCWDEATRQIGAYARSAQRDETGLYVHGIYESGHGGRAPTWADPNGGLSPEVWSEGLGWYALVLVETLADLPKDHSRRAEMEDIFRRLAAGLQRTQDRRSGRWFQVVDKGDRPDNWTDTSGSAMFTYTIARGIEIGLLDRAEYAPVVQRGYKGIVENARINDKGLVDIVSACDGLGVQANYDRYIRFRQSINAKEAVAGFLWATALVERPELEQSAQGQGKAVPRPLYRDPPFDAPTDPVLCFNAEQARWFMYYTARRATAEDTPGVTWIHGTNIGMAESSDGGATWTYRGTAEISYGKDVHPNDTTYWAPEVIWHDGLYHMYVSYVPGIFTDWNHPREIVYLTSKDGIRWDTVGPLDLKSDRVIDACVLQVPGGTWRMWYKDERRPKALCYADSPDLKNWEPKGNAVTDYNGEGPKVFRWKGRYWLVADCWANGMRVWSSEDCTNWRLQAEPLFGSHGDVVVSGDRAWWFYFGGPRGPGEPRGGRTTAINVVELSVVDGKLIPGDPAQPTLIDLKPVREEER